MSSGKVLVVDDNPDYVDMYARWLADEFDVETAYGGETALARLDSDIDVVLLDRRMPDLRGEKVLEVIEERYADCRIAMVTAVEPDFDVIEMGFDDYLIKPVSKRDLRETVHSLRELSEYTRRIRRLYSLASKQAALEANKPPSELTDNPEYASLQQEVATVRERASESLSRITDDVEPDVLFQSI